MEYGKAQRLIQELGLGDYDNATSFIVGGKQYRAWKKVIDGKSKVIVEEERKLSTVRKVR